MASEAPKRERTRLAKAELWLGVASTVQGWADDLELAGTGEGIRRRPAFDEWPEDDFFLTLARKYGLSAPDLIQMITEIADALERRAVRAGYDDITS